MLTHLRRMEFPTIINWTGPFPGLLSGIFHFYSNFKRAFCKQTVETQNVASDLGLHCLRTSHKKEARLISRLGMSVTTQGGSGRQYVTGPGRNISR